jgi:hypothetical protein
MVTLSAGTNAELRSHLARFRRRLRLRDGWLRLQRTSWLAGLGVLLLQLGGRLWPIQQLELISLLPLLAWFAAGVGSSWLRPRPARRVAQRVDLELGLKERLSTAVALGTAAPGPVFPAELVALQRADALAAARSIEPRRAFPLLWLRRPMLAAAGLLLAALSLAYLPNPMDAVLAERQAVARAAEQQAERLEALRQEVEQSTELSPQARAELLRQLEELARALRENSGDRSQALADLSRLEDSLRRQLDPNAAARQAALQALAAQLQALAGQQPGDKADLAGAQRALQQLADQLGQLSPSQQQSQAQALAQQAARAAQGGEPALAQALAALAQAVQAGDTQQASQAAQAAGEALAQAGSQLAAQGALQQALSQLQSSRQALAQAGQTPGQGQNQGQNQNQGQGQGQSQGQGQGQSQGQGQPGGGGGSKANTLPPAQGSGQYSGQPQGQGQAPGQTPLESQVYVPWERLTGGNGVLSIPGQESGQGETESRQTTSPLPGAPSQALVPYQVAYYIYADAANRAIQQSYIPPGLKDYVRDYFSQLEP